VQDEETDVVESSSPENDEESANPSEDGDVLAELEILYNMSNRRSECQQSSERS